MSHLEKNNQVDQDWEQIYGQKSDKLWQLILGLEQNDRDQKKLEAKIEAMQERVIKINQKAQELADAVSWLKS